jgi:hypothetical protein
MQFQLASKLQKFWLDELINWTYQENIFIQKCDYFMVKIISFVDIYYFYEGIFNYQSNEGIFVQKFLYLG